MDTAVRGNEMWPRRVRQGLRPHSQVLKAFRSLRRRAKGSSTPSLLPAQSTYLGGPWERGLGRWSGACFPGCSGHPPETRSASPWGQEGAGRTARGRTRSEGHCLQSHVCKDDQPRRCLHLRSHPQATDLISKTKPAPTGQSRLQLLVEKGKHFICNESNSKEQPAG